MGIYVMNEHVGDGCACRWWVLCRNIPYQQIRVKFEAIGHKTASLKLFHSELLVAIAHFGLWTLWKIAYGGNWTLIMNFLEYLDTWSAYGDNWTIGVLLSREWLSHEHLGVLGGSTWSPAFIKMTSPVHMVTWKCKYGKGFFALHAHLGFFA